LFRETLLTPRTIARSQPRTSGSGVCGWPMQRPGHGLSHARKHLQHTHTCTQFGAGCHIARKHTRAVAHSHIVLHRLPYREKQTHTYTRTHVYTGCPPGSMATHTAGGRENKSSARGDAPHALELRAARQQRVVLTHLATATRRRAQYARPPPWRFIAREGRRRACDKIRSRHARASPLAGVAAVAALRGGAPSPVVGRCAARAPSRSTRLENSTP
jgi:hypothetical protein